MPQRPILLSGGLAAMEGKHRHIRDPPQLGATRGNVPNPRKKHQSRIRVRVLGGDSGHACHKLRPTPRPAGQRLILLRHRKHLGRGRDHRHPQQRGKPLGIRGGRHGNHPKLRAQHGKLRNHAQQYIAIKLAFMHLVYDDRPHPGKLRVPQQPSNQHLRRHKLHQPAGLRIAPNRVTHPIPNHAAIQ